MLMEGKTCIITDYDGLRKKMKNSSKKMKKKLSLANSLKNMSATKMKRMYAK